MSEERAGDLTIKVELDAIDVNTVRSKTPVVSGNLRDGFELDIEGNMINLVDYADEIEFGSVNKPGAFMVTQSLDEMGERLANRVAEQIDKPGLITLPDIVIKAG